MHLITNIIICVAAFLSCATLALASNGRKQENGSEYPVLLTKLSIEQAAQSDISGVDASIGYTEFSASLEWKFLLLSIDLRDYEWRNGASFRLDPGLEPWSKLTRIAPGFQYYHEFVDNWGVWLKFVAIAGFENNISPQSWAYNPQFITFYMPGRKMKLYGGLGTLYHPVYSIVYPVLGIAWNMDSRSGFSVAVGFPETMVRYSFNKSVSIKMDFQWDIRIYRLTDNNLLGSGGYVKIEDLKPGIRFEYKPVKGLTLSSGVRLYLGRSLIIFDRQKTERTNNDISPSWALMFGINCQF